MMLGACQSGSERGNVAALRFHDAFDNVKRLSSCHTPGIHFSDSARRAIRFSRSYQAFLAFIFTQFGILSRNVNMAALLPEVRGLQADEVRVTSCDILCQPYRLALHVCFD